VSTPQCRHELDPAACADCQPRSPRLARPARRPVEARHPGTCPGCTEEIRLGDAIVPDEDNSGQWLHEECA